MTDKEIEETIETPTEVEAQVLEFKKPDPDNEEPTFHSLLEVWDTILDGAVKVGRQEKPTPQWCNQMLQTYSQLTFSSAAALHYLYFSRIGVLRDLLLERIKENPDCFKTTTPNEDRDRNGKVYKQLLTDWQVQIVQWEVEWDPESEDAAIEVASLGEIHKAFFGQTGLTQYLDNIQLEFTEADSAALQAQLTAVREGGDSE